MQSGYGGGGGGGGGGVSEIQQFMVEGCSPAGLFPISAATAPSVDLHVAPHHRRHHHHQPPPQPPPHFPHFHPIPITQQLFHHQFHLFHHPPPHEQHEQQQQRRLQLQQLGLDQESGPENSSSPHTPMMGGGAGGGSSGGGGSPSFLTAAMNFRLAVNESSGGGGGGGSRDGLNDDEGILQGDDASESRLHHWQREEESSIKEPFWRPLDIDYINRNNKRCKEKQPSAPAPPEKYCKKSREGGEQDHGNYKLFSELEAIYKPGAGNNQTASGSALTGENPVAQPAAPAEQHVGAVLNHGSEASTGEEAPVKKFQKSGGRRKRQRRRRQLSSIAAFFEGLVKQLMDHQEGLHRKFLEVMERRDQERASREEAWRRQEAAKSSREAAARAHERALASDREAAIIAFLEKITGETLNLPANPHDDSHPLDDNSADNNANSGEPSDALFANNQGVVQLNNSRWPKAEVQALIRVRSGLESRFQEPGLKGPLWEEVSSTMAVMGYSRSAKRCKEKWENINKYFRKTKDSGKKRPQHSKTCPYFHQLDQLYSNKLPLPPPPPSLPPPPAAAAEERKDSSELLDAIVVSNDNPMGSLRFDFNGDVGEGDHNEGNGTMIAAGKELMELGRQQVDGEEGDGLERDHQAGGESQEESQQGYKHFKKQQHKHHDDSPLFFQRLES